MKRVLIFYILLSFFCSVAYSIDCTHAKFDDSSNMIKALCKIGARNQVVFLPRETYPTQIKFTTDATQKNKSLAMAIDDNKPMKKISLMPDQVIYSTSDKKQLLNGSRYLSPPKIIESNCKLCIGEIEQVINGFSLTREVVCASSKGLCPQASLCLKQGKLKVEATGEILDSFPPNHLPTVPKNNVVVE